MMGGIAHTQKVRHHIFGCEEEFDSAFECAGYNIMAKKVRQGRSWSMQTDRELIALSKTHALEALADQLQLPPKLILARARRLGLSIKRTAKR